MKQPSEYLQSGILPARFCAAGDGRGEGRLRRSEEGAAERRDTVKELLETVRADGGSGGTFPAGGGEGVPEIIRNFAAEKNRFRWKN